MAGRSQGQWVGIDGSAPDEGIWECWVSEVAPYADRMTALRLVAFLLLALVAAAPQALPTKQAGSDNPGPKLPVIDHTACPLEGDAVPNVKIYRLDHICSSWQSSRKITGTLKPW